VVLEEGILPLQLALLAEESLEPLPKLAFQDGGQFFQQFSQAAGFGVCGLQLPLEAAQGGRGRGRRGGR
jgi:hypothetical protein